MSTRFPRIQQCSRQVFACPQTHQPMGCTEFITHSQQLQPALVAYIFTDQTYVKVIPTKINVISIENSITTIKIGYNQSYTLLPAVYSLDWGNLTNTRALSYSFYFQLINSTTNASNLNITTLTDLSQGISPNCYFSTTSK